MITVKIDLDKWGIGLDITSLCTLKIWNDGKGTHTIGNYGYEIRGKKDVLMKQGQILNHPRAAQHVIMLLQKVINDAYPPKTKKSKNE